MANGKENPISSRELWMRKYVSNFPFKFNLTNLLESIITSNLKSPKSKNWLEIPQL